MSIISRLPSVPPSHNADIYRLSFIVLCRRSSGCHTGHCHYWQSDADAEPAAHTCLLSSAFFPDRATGGLWLAKVDEKLSMLGFGLTHTLGHEWVLLVISHLALSLRNRPSVIRHVLRVFKSISWSSAPILTASHHRLHGYHLCVGLRCLFISMFGRVHRAHRCWFYRIQDISTTCDYYSITLLCSLSVIAREAVLCFDRRIHSSSSPIIISQYVWTSLGWLIEITSNMFKRSSNTKSTSIRVRLSCCLPFSIRRNIHLYTIHILKYHL